ncbi:MAG: VWA domain-containing protein [Actinomycetota bacterium]
MADFSADVFQNEYLPAGGDTLDAVITVTSGANVSAAGSKQLVEVIIIDVSGSMNEDRGAKIQAAKVATMAAVDTLDDGVEFAIIAGTDRAHQLYPRNGLAVADAGTRREAKDTIQRVRADGGTAIGTWLQLAAQLHRTRPDAISHSILLTDGKNQHEPHHVLQASIDACIGLFQCDCRGLGTDWNVDEMRLVADALLGTVDIIPRPEDMEAEFRALISSAMKREVANVALRLWSPKGAQMEFLKQVSPTIEDMTGKGLPVNPLTNDYPLGAWSPGESRDYHLRVKIPAGGVGDERLGARVMLAINDEAEPIALVRAIWTDDENLSTRINREVAHYTGQAELAEAIHDGLAARAGGDEESATMKLGRAVQIAHETGNVASARLLEKVVDVDDPEAGTVRLKRNVAAEDEMALDVRSTRTVRVGKQGS